VKLGFTTWNYEEEIVEGKADIFSLMQLARDLGFEAIEIMGYHLADIEDAYLDRVKRRAAELGLAICALDARNMSFGGRWFQLRQDVAAIKFWTQAAAKLGCPVVGLFLGKYETREGRLAQLRVDAQAFAECAAFARPYGVKYGIENHRIYITDKEVDPDETEAEDLPRVLDMIGSPLFGSIPDCDNFFRRNYPALTPDERERNYAHFDRLMPRAVHVHVKVKGTDQGDAREQCDMRRLADILRKHGYDGSVAFEFMKPLLEGKDAVLAANRAALSQSLAG